MVASSIRATSLRDQKEEIYAFEAVLPGTPCVIKIGKGRKGVTDIKVSGSNSRGIWLDVYRENRLLCSISTHCVTAMYSKEFVDQGPQPANMLDDISDATLDKILRDVQSPARGHEDCCGKPQIRQPDSRETARPECRVAGSPSMVEAIKAGVEEGLKAWSSNS